MQKQTHSLVITLNDEKILIKTLTNLTFSIASEKQIHDYLFKVIRTFME